MSGNGAPLLSFLLNSSGVFPGLQIAYALFVLALTVFLSWMMWKRKGFEEKDKRDWCIALLVFLVLFALLFLGFNSAMVNAIEEEKKKKVGF